MSSTPPMSVWSIISPAFGGSVVCTRPHQGRWLVGLRRQFWQSSASGILFIVRRPPRNQRLLVSCVPWFSPSEGRQQRVSGDGLCCALKHFFNHGAGRRLPIPIVWFSHTQGSVNSQAEPRLLHGADDLTAPGKVIERHSVSEPFQNSPQSPQGIHCRLSCRRIAQPIIYGA